LRNPDTSKNLQDGNSAPSRFKGLQPARSHAGAVFRGVLAAANLPAARRLFVTVAEAFEAGQVVQQARAANPGIEIIARAHSDAEVEHLTRLGADLIVMGEREIAHRMLERARAAPEAPSAAA
jgi:CPA2 family monovalent cation:H+ antiporter-2